MEVAEDLLEEGKALLSYAVERERGGFPEGWRNDFHVHGTPIAMRRRTSQAQLENFFLFQIQHEITSLSFLDAPNEVSGQRHQRPGGCIHRDRRNPARRRMAMNGTGSGAVLAASPIGSGGSRLISKGPYMGITELRFPRGLGVKRLEDLLDAAAPTLRTFPLPFLVLFEGEDFLEPVVAFPAFVRIGGHGTSSFPAERIGLEVPLGMRIINELGVNGDTIPPERV
jgi:hypothetical protein